MADLETPTATDARRSARTSGVTPSRHRGRLRSGNATRSDRHGKDMALSPPNGNTQVRNPPEAGSEEPPYALFFQAIFGGSLLMLVKRASVA